MEDLIKPPVVVRSPNWLGDAIMAFPAVASLRAHLKDGHITVAAPAALAPLWKLCPFVDHVMELKRPKNAMETSRQLKVGKFETAILLPNSFRCAMEARLAKIPNIYGYSGDGRNWMLKKAIPKPFYDPEFAHHQYYYLELLTALGVKANDTFPSIRLHDAPKKENRLALFPGAEYGPAKRWPANFYAKLAQQFKDERRSSVILLGVKKDVPVTAEIAEEVPWVENLAGKTDLEQVMLEILRSRLVVCNDSGAMHLASLLGVPTLAIFGSTDPDRTSPLGLNSHVARHHVPCSPCFLRECPIDFACMRSLTPEKIWVAASSLWDKSTPA